MNESKNVFQMQQSMYSSEYTQQQEAGASKGSFYNSSGCSQYRRITLTRGGALYGSYLTSAAAACRLSGPGTALPL